MVDLITEKFRHQTLADSQLRIQAEPSHPVSKFVKRNKCLNLVLGVSRVSSLLDRGGISPFSLLSNVFENSVF
jgi:hypothetical protein